MRLTHHPSNRFREILPMDRHDVIDPFNDLGKIAHWLDRDHAGQLSGAHYGSTCADGAAGWVSVLGWTINYMIAMHGLFSIKGGDCVKHI